MIFSDKKVTVRFGWTASALLAGALFAYLPSPAQAQRRATSFNCESTDGRRTACNVDVTNGVRLTRQLGDTRCIEGFNWGSTDAGVWVSRGCRAEFLLPGDPYRPIARVTRIEAGTQLAVRTNETIRSSRADGRIYSGIIENDVLGSNGQLAIPAGSNVEMMVRTARDNDLILDIESVMVNGQRYALDTAVERIDSQGGGAGVGANERTGKYVGGGAALGAILGAIAGGGKGAAIGAGAGAAAGAIGQTATQGREVRLPVESIVTFRVDTPMTVGVADYGDYREGSHYHDYQNR